MCYSIAQQKKRAYDAAIRAGVAPEILEKIKREWEEAQKGDEMLKDRLNYRVSGFEHPKLYTLINQEQFTGTRFTWGLIPAWVKNEKQAFEIWNHTLNARGETLFEKPAFRESAMHKRCLIFVDGFYEHHHFRGKTYPFFIQPQALVVPFVLGGLWSEWVNPETGEIFQTTSIVTTEGNSLMQKIHNNPKLSGPRMPLILEPSAIEIWLKSNNQNEVKELIVPYPAEKIRAYTVGRITGKNALSDSPESIEEVVYPGIEFKPN